MSHPSGYVEIILNRGKTAKIDRDDIELVKKHKSWCVIMRHGERNSYAMTYTHGKQWYMHRLIMSYKRTDRGAYEYTPIPVGLVVDHINGDGLDNRRSNLRVVTNAINARNTYAKRTGKPINRSRKRCPECEGRGYLY